MGRKAISTRTPLTAKAKRKRDRGTESTPDGEVVQGHAERNPHPNAERDRLQMAAKYNDGL
jgi:hypothetical protein